MNENDPSSVVVAPRPPGLSRPVGVYVETINRDASKLRLPDARKIRHRKACQFMSAANRQLLVVENADDLGRQNRLKLLNFGVGQAKGRGTRCRCRGSAPYRRSF
jgi:hypothetical protein